MTYTYQEPPNSWLKTTAYTPEEQAERSPEMGKINTEAQEAKRWLKPTGDVSPDDSKRYDLIFGDGRMHLDIYSFYIDWRRQLPHHSRIVRYRVANPNEKRSSNRWLKPVGDEGPDTHGYYDIIFGEGVPAYGVYSGTLDWGRDREHSNRIVRYREAVVAKSDAALAAIDTSILAHNSLGAFDFRAPDHATLPEIDGVIDHSIAIESDGKKHTVVYSTTYDNMGKMINGASDLAAFARGAK